MVEPSISGVGVVDKAVRVLDALSDGEALTLRELAAATRLPRATAHRLAHALAAHGLARLGPDDRWSLGARLGQLAAAAAVPDDRRLVAAARVPLERLRDATSESVQLYVRRGDTRVCLASLESPHSLRTIVAVGATLPLERGSAGTVLRDERAARRRGWAQSVEEREKGVASVSAPVRRGPDVVAAMSVSGPVERTTRAPGRRYAADVTAAARGVEAALGWSSATLVRP